MGYKVFLSYSSIDLVLLNEDTESKFLNLGFNIKDNMML
jgi:hypothetical protein